MPGIDLQRFIDAQHSSADRALGEIESGRKTSHWMWFVFPQVSGLGLSPISRRYAISSSEEARAFLAHPVLGSRYRRMVDAVWHQVVEGGVTISDLFGSPDDAKLVSSLTLFEGVAPRHGDPDRELVVFSSQAEEILAAAYAQGLHRCAATEQFLGAS